MFETKNDSYIRPSSIWIFVPKFMMVIELNGMPQAHCTSIHQSCFNLKKEINIKKTFAKIIIQELNFQLHFFANCKKSKNKTGAASETNRPN